MKVTMLPVTVACPCGTRIDVPIECEITWDDEDAIVAVARQRLNFIPDYSDLWAHAWTHDETVNFDFDMPGGDA